MVYAINYISSFGQIVEWLERVHESQSGQVVIRDPLYTECSNLTETRWT